MKGELVMKIRMCIKTYFNLYGVTPTIEEMNEWTGEPYEEILQVYLAEGLTVPAQTAA